MAKLGTIATKVRSKNAGPFWLTIDIFCDTSEIFNQVVDKLTTQQIADVFDIDKSEIKRFDIAALNVIKFSLARPAVQGSLYDRDMHGASWASLVAELEI